MRRCPYAVLVYPDGFHGEARYLRCIRRRVHVFVPFAWQHRALLDLPGLRTGARVFVAWWSGSSPDYAIGNAASDDRLEQP